MHRNALAVFLIVSLPLSQLVGCGDERTANSHVADARVAIIEGEARFAGTGKPVAGATLYFFHREDSGSKVVTDRKGRFRWRASRKGVGPGPAGTHGPDCKVMIQDATGWAWEVVEPAVDVPSGADPSNARVSVDCLGSLQKPVGSRWEATDRGMRLIVECPAAGDVEIGVRGPNGSALANRPVRIFPGESPREFRGDGNVEFRGRTDANGVVHLRWFTGTRRLRILVPGVGFASTGAFEVLAGRTLRVNLSPLAPFAQVEGTLDPRLAKPGMVVHRLVEKGNTGAWRRARAVLDHQGRFVLRDVVPGPFFLEVGDSDPSESPRFESQLVRAEPGQHIKGLVIPPPTPPLGAHDVIRVEGTVRDSAGRGVARANVVVRTSHAGGIRMHQQIRETMTDPWGHYRISGSPPGTMSSLGGTTTPIMVFVYAQGRPPVVAYAEVPPAGTAKRGPFDVTLTDAAARGSLHVRILRNGTPCPGANVALRPDGVIDLGNLTAHASERTVAWPEVVALFYPQTTTGADGVAHFANVYPGAYEVTAVGGAPAAVSETTNGKPKGVFAAPDGNLMTGPDAVHSLKRLGYEYAMAEGIGVASGQAAETVLELHPQLGAVPIQVLRPDGQPVASQIVSLSLGRPNPSGSSSLALDARGLGSHQFETPGLWAVRFNDVESKSVPIDEEPFDQAEALLPISPALRLPDPVRLQGGRRERGSSRVEPRPHDDPTRGATTKGAGPSFPGMMPGMMAGLGARTAAPGGDGDTVWLADGKTPAFGARGVLLEADETQPVASGVSDGAGRITWRAGSNLASTRRRNGMEPPKTRAILWLPGLCGAAVVEVERGTPLRAVLPAPIEARGAVSLGGRPSTGVNARLQVVAGHQGDADLDPVLSVSTTADADGRFRLRGLTPGRYRVQAARDGIWLSTSVPLEVEAGQPPAVLALDIPDPGGAMTVELVDRAGHPVPDRSLTLTRPEGPLAALWPRIFRTDRAGQLTLRGLETGTHSIEIDGESAPRHFEAPIARNEAPTPEVVRFVCDDVP